MAEELRFLLDENYGSNWLLRRLREEGFSVERAIDVGLTGEPDEVVWAYAKANGLTLITKDGDDFEILARDDATHPGIVWICEDNDVTRDMGRQEILDALINLTSAPYLELRGRIIVLNHYRVKGSSSIEREP